MIHVLLALLHPTVATGMQLLLHRAPSVLVVGHAATEQETLALAEALHPHIIVLDSDTPSFPGAAMLANLLATKPLIPILVLGDFALLAYGTQMIRDGAAGYLPKSELTQGLVASVKSIVNAGSVNH